MTPANKITGYYDKQVKNIGRYDLGRRRKPKASSVWNTDPWQGNAQAKWTSTVTSNCWLNSGGGARNTSPWGCTSRR